MKKALIFWVILLVMGPLWADEVRLNPSHPETYVVVKGDTLWDIAERFLTEPWYWPKVWHANPEIKNPHLIYPGDIIHLVYEQGRPVLRLSRGPNQVKWSPKARISPISAAIPTIPLEQVDHFLRQARVLSPNELRSAPYVVSGRDAHLLTGSEDRFYVRDLDQKDGVHFNIYREGKKFLEKGDKGDLLGVEADLIGKARVLRYGDPSTLVMESSNREVRVGDRLFQEQSDNFSPYFYPKAPAADLRGKIIHLVDAVKQTGTNQVVVVNLGSEQGVEVGYVFGVYQSGLKVRDKVSGKFNDAVTLPDERAGLVLIYQVFDNVAYGIVMKAGRAIYLGDMVANP